MKFAETNNGIITRKDAADLLRLNVQQAYRILKKMADEGKLIPEGTGKGACYRIKL